MITCDSGTPPSMAEARLKCSLKLTFQKLENYYLIEATIENLTSESAAGVKIGVRRSALLLRLMRRAIAE